MTPEYKPEPEPIVTVTDGDTIQIEESESLAMEFLKFARETARFLMQYVDSVNHFMAEATDEDFRQLDRLMQGLDPNDPVTYAVAETIEQAKTLKRINKEQEATYDNPRKIPVFSFP